jgi:hypothetical protein
MGFLNELFKYREQKEIKKQEREKYLSRRMEELKVAEEERKSSKERMEEEKLKKIEEEKDQKRKQEAHAKATEIMQERVENFLKRNPGRYFSKKDLNLYLEITTQSEDSALYSSLNQLPKKPGFTELLERDVFYYYYVDPDR